MNMEPFFCPQKIVWGDVATWFSAVGTIGAVIVAMITSGRAFNLSRTLKNEEDRRLEDVRKLQCTAYSAAIVDDLWEVMRHINLAINLLSSNPNPKLNLVRMSNFELSQIDTSTFNRMLEHVEVFGESGKQIARIATTLTALAKTAARNYELTKNLDSVPDGHVAQMLRNLRMHVLKIKGVAPMFYEMATIENDSRRIKPLTPEEEAELREYYEQQKTQK